MVLTGYIFGSPSQRQKRQNSTSGITSNRKVYAKQRKQLKQKRLPNEWEKIVANHISDKGLISKV